MARVLIVVVTAAALYLQSCGLVLPYESRLFRDPVAVAIDMPAPIDLWAAFPGPVRRDVQRFRDPSAFLSHLRETAIAVSNRVRISAEQERLWRAARRALARGAADQDGPCNTFQSELYRAPGACCAVQVGERSLGFCTLMNAIDIPARELRRLRFETRTEPEVGATNIYWSVEKDTVFLNLFACNTYDPNLCSQAQNPQRRCDSRRAMSNTTERFHDPAYKTYTRSVCRLMLLRKAASTRTRRAAPTMEGTQTPTVHVLLRPTNHSVRALPPAPVPAAHPPSGVLPPSLTALTIPTFPVPALHTRASPGTSANALGPAGVPTLDCAPIHAMPLRCAHALVGSAVLPVCVPQPNRAALAARASPTALKASRPQRRRAHAAAAAARKRTRAHEPGSEEAELRNARRVRNRLAVASCRSWKLGRVRAIAEEREQLAEENCTLRSLLRRLEAGAVKPLLVPRGTRGAVARSAARGGRGGDVVGGNV